MQTKKCPKCHLHKDLESFHKDKNRVDGRTIYCKDCRHLCAEQRWKDSKIYHASYRELNKDIIKKKQRDYLVKNRKTIMARKALYKKEREINDPEYRLKSRIRTRIWNVLKGGGKSQPTLKLLGCTIAQLKSHLESQFSEGMSWENHRRDGWHIDHVLPCASFDLTDPKQQAECFHYTNLQPLWAEDNLKKGSMIQIHKTNT